MFEMYLYLKLWKVAVVAHTYNPGTGECKVILSFCSTASLGPATWDSSEKKIMFYFFKKYYFYAFFKKIYFVYRRHFSKNIPLMFYFF